MAKFKVGDEVAVAAIMKIAAIQPQSNGTVSYSTDRGITIPEHLMEQIALAPKEKKAEEPSPAPEPPKFYTGKVFAEKSTDPFFESRDGKIFEFVDGECVNASFKDSMRGEIRNINHLREMKSCTTWHEVKSDV